MIAWITANSTLLGGSIVAFAGLVVAAYTKLQSMKVDKANTDSKVQIAESQKEVYEQLKERVSDLASQVDRLTTQIDALREQIRVRDSKIHTMELHIKDLEHTLRAHQIEPPSMLRE